MFAYIAVVSHARHAAEINIPLLVKETSGDWDACYIIDLCPHPFSPLNSISLGPDLMLSIALAWSSG
jgi:hypothetical protein